MKLSDIPKHVTELDPPWFGHQFKKKYLKYPGNEPPNFEDVEPCFHLKYYDGPLSGIAKFDGHYFYVKCIYDEDRKWWASWELTPEERTSVLENNRLFEEHVGSHNSYIKNENEDFVRNLDLVKPQESWDKFYKNANKPKVDYDSIEQRDIFGILRNPFWNYC